MRAKTILIFLFLISLLFGCAPSIKNLESKGENIICFGDSITKGGGVKESDSYPKVLERLIKREIINAGASGDTTVSALKRLERDVLNKNPFLVIVELGGNDFLQQVPREVTLKNLEEIILRIQEEGSAVALSDLSCGFILSGYRRDFKRLAQKTGSIFIPRLLEGILDNPALRHNHIHPNKQGQALIAERIYKAVSKYFDFGP